MKKTMLAISLFAVLAVAWYLYLITQVHEHGAASQKMLAQGVFRTVAHESKSRATIHQFADGKRVLRLTDFATSNAWMSASCW